jgi:hypothetical protein
MASSSYNSLKGENCVPLDLTVLCDQMTLGNSSPPLALRLLRDVLLDANKDNTIGSLNCSIGFWVIQRSKAQLHPQLLRKTPKCCTIELLAIANYYFPWNREVAHDVLPEEFL